MKIEVSVKFAVKDLINVEHDYFCKRNIKLLECTRYLELTAKVLRSLLDGCS